LPIKPNSKQLEGGKPRVPNYWDSRVAEAPAYRRQERNFAKPVVYLHHGIFIYGDFFAKEGCL